MTGKKAKKKAPAKAGADPLPAGWGHTPENPEEHAKARSQGQLYEFEAGASGDLSNDPFFVGVVTLEFMKHIELYEESLDVTHLWRAWRTSRNLSDLPRGMFAKLAKHFDALSEGYIESSTRVEQRERRDTIIRTFNTLAEQVQAGTPNGFTSLAQIHRHLAKSFNTTPGAIKTIILDYERGLGS